MTTQNETKLKTLLNNMIPGTVGLASWLEELGISRNLQKHYRKSGWLESLGRGAFKRPGDKVQWQGGIYALQSQAKLYVHVGAITALSMQGFSHYFRLNEEKVYLFSPQKKMLPKWFRSYIWENPIVHIRTSLFSTNIGTLEHRENNFSIKISSPERAIFECLLLTPKTLDLIECYHLMEGLVNLKPKLLIELLQKCNSIKVKRLFLYLSEKANHQWLKFIDIPSVNLGNGNRIISGGGVYISKYQITIPKELAKL